MSPPDIGKRRSQAVRHLSIATTIIAIAAVIAGVAFDLGPVAIGGGALFIGVHILLIGVGGGIITALARRHARPNNTHQDDTTDP